MLIPWCGINRQDINTTMFEKWLPGKHYFSNFIYTKNTASGVPEVKH